MSYTKGEWIITDNNALEIETDEQEICRLYQNNEDRANAQLIASAPELLEACKEIANFCDNNIFQTPLIQKYINKCKQAINKADGK